MRKLNIATIVVISAVVTVAGAVLGVGIGNCVYQDNKNKDVVELFIDNVRGVDGNDIRLCRGAYLNGGHYFHKIKNVKLECSKNHISVDFDREE